MLKTTLAATVITLAAGVAHAVTVDNFTTTGTTGSVIGTGGESASFSDGGGIGTTRVVEASIVDTAMAGLNGEVRADSNDLNNARFEFETSSLANGAVSLTYSGLGGVDLSGGPLQFADVVNDSAFSLNVAITSGTTTEALDFTIGAFNVMEDLVFDISGLSTASSADEIVFTLVSDDQSGDISFGEISIVPVPAAGLLLLGAVGGIAALRRLKAA